MENLKIETITERLFPEKFNEKLTPSQKFSAEIGKELLRCQSPKEK